jgi:hypothetical protein
MFGTQLSNVERIWLDFRLRTGQPELALVRVKAFTAESCTPDSWRVILKSQRLQYRQQTQEV